MTSSPFLTAWQITFSKGNLSGGQQKTKGVNVKSVYPKGTNTSRREAGCNIVRRPGNVWRMEWVGDSIGGVGVCCIGWIVIVWVVQKTRKKVKGAESELWLEKSGSMIMTTQRSKELELDSLRFRDPYSSAMKELEICHEIPRCPLSIFWWIWKKCL